MKAFDYDLFVIGGGSGGVRAGRLAASLGKRVAIAEEYRYGGTCVIRGCVPKKLFVYASKYAGEIEDAAGYGWKFGKGKFNWKTLLANKDAEIARLEGLYRRGLENAGAEILDTRAELHGKHEVYLLREDRVVTAERILIAAGGKPYVPEKMPGSDLCITSSEAFHLSKLPKSILIVGAGYIALEFAGIFNGLGVETTVLLRGEQILRGFDEDIRESLHTEMVAKGIHIITQDNLHSVEKDANGLVANLVGGRNLHIDQIMLATGRVPNTKGLGLEKAGVTMNEKGAIEVNEYSRTSAENIWAVGDITDRINLTPVAIHEAMCFIETEYKGNPQRPDHELVPTAVFSQPEIGTVGKTEHEAALDHEIVHVYLAKFRPMKHTLSGREEKMVMKILVDGTSDKVVGIHLLGPDSGELSQALGIVVKAGATKTDFDRTMAVHPTAAEELVTMYQPSYTLENGVRQDAA